MAAADSVVRRAGWLAFAAATLWLAAALPTQPVDPHNRALKAPTSVDARRMQALAEALPDDPIVLLAFTAPGDLPIADADRGRLRAVRAAVAALPGVVDVAMPPVDDAGLALLPVAIQGDDLLAVGEAVVATARAAAPPSLRLIATGLPLLEGTIARLVAAERTSVVPWMLGVLFGAALLFYRRLHLAVAVLLPPLAGIAWTAGALARLGHTLDPIGALLEPVLLTIGVAGSVHFVEAFRNAAAGTADRRTAATIAAREMRTPALLATATTMIGLWSLATSDVPAIVDFGLRAALGVGITHVCLFLILPAWLGNVGSAPTPARPSEALARPRRRPRGLVPLVGAAAACAFAAAGVVRLQVDNDPLRMLPANEPTRVDHEALARRLGGVEAFVLVVPPRSAAAEPSRLLPFVAAVRELPAVAGLAGPVRRGAGGELAVPFRLAPGGSGERVASFAACERTAAVLGFPEVVPTGAAVQIARDSHRAIHALLGSLGVSFVLLGAAMAIGLRSWRLGCLGLLTNTLPSLWLYGALGWLGQPLTLATAMIGCTMLGLVVDNTLYLLHHYRTLRGGRSAETAMREALARCRRAVHLASAVLMLGFLTATASNLSTTVEFGLLASATIGAAWAGTILILPVLVTTLAARGSAARRRPHGT